MKVVFVVNGESSEVDIFSSETLLMDIVENVTASEYPNRPLSEWELRHECGVLITNLTKPFREYGFLNGAYLYLTFAVGFAG